MTGGTWRVFYTSQIKSCKEYLIPTDNSVCDAEILQANI